MTTRVYFDNVERSESLEASIIDRFQEIVGRFFPDAGKAYKADVDVNVGCEGSLAKNTPRSYHCELTLRSSRFPAVFVRKTAGSFRTALALAAQGLAHALAHAKGRHLSRRHRKAKRIRTRDLDFGPILSNSFSP